MTAAVLLNQFGSQSTQSHASSYYESRFTSIANYWFDASYSQFSFGGAVLDWEELPLLKNQYNSGSASGFHNSVIQDVINLHDSSVNFNNFDSVFIIYNDHLPVCGCAFAFLGPISVTTNEGVKSLYVSHYPSLTDGWVFDTIYGGGVEVVAHEMGHNLGLLHTTSTNGNDNWSLMNPTAHINSNGAIGPLAWQKDDLGWISASDKVTISDGTSLVVALDVISDPSPSSNYLIGEIPFGVSGDYYTVEVRKDSTYDQTPLDQFGLMIYNYDSSENTLGIVDTNNTPSNLDNADLDSGQTFTENNVKFEYLSDTATSITLRISNNVPCSPPGSGTWTLTTSCTMTASATAPGNVLVQNNSILTIPSGITLDINFSSFNLTVKSGSGVSIESGGTVT